ncbi:MAG: hypothetical protein KIT31_31905 [Deltaproteobacteria bacterium]|nr:hypothetical protein [Deltaproteobacteria bacterium]
MESKENTSSAVRVFTDVEFRSDPDSVIAHAAASGPVLVTRADGTPNFMIAIPPAETSGSDPED